MKKYIVVGIDSSPTSQNALRWALDEAAIRDCELHAVHAYEQSMIGAVPESGAVVFPRDLLEQYAVGMLDTAVDSVIGDRDEVTHIVRSATEGAPAKVLIEDAYFVLRGIAWRDPVLSCSKAPFPFAQ